MWRASLGVLVAVSAWPASARGDERLDLELPDVALYAPAFHLDRDTPYDERTTSGHVGWIDLGGGAVDDGGTFDPQTGQTGIAARNAFLGSAGAAVGRQGEQLIALWRSELSGATGRGVRGHHRGLLELRTRYTDDLGLDGTLTTDLEHGDARALGPVRVGPGARTTGDVGFEMLVRIGKKKSDMRLVAVTGVESGGTAWQPEHAPTVQSEQHNGVTIGVAGAPADGELPRGRLDIVRLHVENQNISLRPSVMPVDPAQPLGPGNGGAGVRTIDVMTGAEQLTFHVDDELFTIIDANIGGSWLEAENAAGTIHDSALKFRLATGVKWLPKDESITRGVGFNFSRLPTTSPDGQRILADWRLELASAVETDGYDISARGGVSWIEPIAGGLAGARTLIRYGMEVEAFAKITRGVEAGVSFAASFEPRVTGDPWATPRRWADESGVLVRYRR